MEVGTDSQKKTMNYDVYENDSKKFYKIDTNVFVFP